MQEHEAKRFLEIQTGAVELAAPIRDVVRQRLSEGGELVFVGTGGAAILMDPAQRLLDVRSRRGARSVMAAELVAAGSPHVDAHALVVMPSLSGTTPETLSALEYCRSRGAYVVALTGAAGSPLAEGADTCLPNEAADDTSSESFELQALLFALALMDLEGTLEDYDAVASELLAVPRLLVEVKRQCEPDADAAAGHLAAEPWHILSGAGLTWAAAYYYGMCILEEMQWIRTRPVHASDFFHGTLELVEPGVSVVLLKGEDWGRRLVERVERFVPRHTSKLLVLDSASYALPGISSATRALLSPVVLATVLERVSARLEQLTDHPLTTRRYYRQTEY